MDSPRKALASRQQEEPESTPPVLMLHSIEGTVLTAICLGYLCVFDKLLDPLHFDPPLRHPKRFYSRRRLGNGWRIRLARPQARALEAQQARAVAMLTRLVHHTIAVLLFELTMALALRTHLDVVAVVSGALSGTLSGALSGEFCWHLVACGRCIRLRCRGTLRLGQYIAQCVSLAAESCQTAVVRHALLCLRFELSLHLLAWLRPLLPQRRFVQLSSHAESQADAGRWSLHKQTTCRNRRLARSF